MRKITSLAILGLMWLAGSASAFADDHGYVNGICTMHDDCPEHFEAPKQDADGFYMLCNAGNVEWISDLVANGNLDPNCKLMNDIDFENIENLHRPIGPNDGKKYNGTFDGQGFRIKNMIINRPSEERQGFFGDLRGNPNSRGEGTVIKNLIIDKSCSITGALRTGGITGTGQNNAMEINIINCVNEASITTTAKNAGGITGGSTSTHPIWKIINCVNTGTITSLGDGESGGISGWLGDNGSTIVRNCINIGEVNGIDASGRGVFRQSRDCGVNCYDLSGNEMAFQYVDHEFTADDVVNGKLTYVINQLAGSIVYWQTLGVDEYPMPFSTSKQVYLQGEVLCDGTPIEGGTYTNNPVEPVRPPHEYDEGDFYCINCGKISDDFCEKDAEGFYQLNNELDVCWFAEYVKAGNVEVNAKLNADLDFTDYSIESAYCFSGIGDRDHGFKGIFDGGFHTISNMDMTWREGEEWVGFINFLNGGATVKNLRGDATCFINATGNAGFIGGSTAPGDIHLENLGFEGDVYCSRSGAGGILGCNTGSQAHIYMTNCYVTGFISGSTVMENGALSAWLGGSGAVITGCWSSATVSGYQNGDKYLARFNDATFTNCFCTVPEEDINPLQATIVEYEDIESGALCYKLNGNQENITWFQDLGSDEFPTFMPGHKQVYANGQMRCDGVFIGDEITYSNTNGSVKPDHQFADGFCKVCHQQDPDFPFLDVFPNADHDVNTGYTTHNGGDGSNLGFESSVVEHWNSSWFESYQTIKNLEPGIYRLRVQGLSRVAQWGNAEHNAYETGELSEEYAPLYHSSQYFAEVNGKKIANRFMDITEGRQKERVGETENYSEETDAWVPNSRTACMKYFARGLYWNEPIYFAIENAEDSVNVGVENSLYLYGNWTVWDSWRLDKIADGSIELIRKQQEAAIQHDIEDLLPQLSLMEAYNKAKNDIANASTLQQIMDASDVLARYPNLIRRSHLAYENFQAAIEAIRDERSAREDLNGAAADLLDKYLDEDEEASEELPNGTFINIIDARTLNEEELAAEIEFAKELYNNAILTSVSEGSDISNIIKNAAFTADGNFQDWETEITFQSSAGSNFSSNTGFTDIYPVAGSWNTAFNVSQYIVADIPDGIYELEVPAFYRPGPDGRNENCTSDFEGNDYVPADLFINDFYTPIMNIYAGRVLYADAINGVNCRYDASGDPEAPHNGESTSAQDFDTGDGYVPEQRQAVSFAFAGGRYINKVYGLVQGGELRLGIRNTGKPWYESGMTMWGKFKLTYRGNSSEAIQAMIENFESRLAALKYAHDDQWFMFYSLSHIDKIESLIAEVKHTSGAQQIANIRKLNDEFNTILDSYDAYEELLNLYEFCSDKGQEYFDAGDETKSEAFFEVASEIQSHYTEGDLTDEEARNYRETILNDPALGGGYYVQGDLLDAEGNDLPYDGHCTLYPMTLQEDGTYLATGVKVQNRANLANANARAGLYINRMDEVYKANQSTRRFVTPATTTFTLAKGAGNDLQMVGGEFNVTFNPATGETKVETVSYNWSDNVYVVGSIINQAGQKHRWKNDEMAPLAHKGNGLYEGIVTFYRDSLENYYPNFTIFSCRSNTAVVPYATTTRGGWNEGRYGSDENKLILEDGVALGDLIRGADRKWYMNWNESSLEETQRYLISFDMNHNTIVTRNLYADLNLDGKTDIADAVAILEVMARDEYSTAADLNGDSKVDIADFVAVLETMAKQ